MYIPKFLKPSLRDDLNCFPDTNFKSLLVELNIKMEMRTKFIIVPKKTCKDLEKLVIEIDLAIAEGKFVILAGDYKLNYFAKRNKSLLQS